MSVIKPRLPKGFRDYLPTEELARERMLHSIRRTFERFGFVPLETPGIEFKETLTGGSDDFGMHIFTAGINGENEKLALRFDLPVPLARVVSEHANEIKKPFKRYQIGNVWRGENPQAGRYREFMQCDADIVGSQDILADAEIIALMYAVLSDLGIKNFVIRVNNRKLLNALAVYAGFSETKIPNVLRIVDKLEKQGWGAVKKEFEAEGLIKKEIDAIQKFLDISEKDHEKALMKAESVLGDKGKEGIGELKKLLEYADAFSIPRNSWMFDFSIARGLGYYTGIVFETVLTDLPKFGSVMSGGRYDNLTERFGAQKIPATGVSLGIDRLFAALKELKLQYAEKSITKALVLNFDAESELLCAKAVNDIRARGIPAEIYLGNEKSMKGQLAYALKNEIPFVIIIGSDERARGVAQIKNLEKREQKEIPLEKLGSEFLKIIS